VARDHVADVVSALHTSPDQESSSNSSQMATP
jgi:hypothetical protein